jgi:hypothetical protein
MYVLFHRRVRAQQLLNHPTKLVAKHLSAPWTLGRSLALLKNDHSFLVKSSEAHNFELLDWRGCRDHLDFSHTDNPFNLSVKRRKQPPKLWNFICPAVSVRHRKLRHFFQEATGLPKNPGQHSVRVRTTTPFVPPPTSTPAVIHIFIDLRQLCEAIKSLLASYY